MSLGAQRREGKGSGVVFYLGGVVASFHRPHPGNEAKEYQVKNARALEKWI